MQTERDRGGEIRRQLNVLVRLATLDRERDGGQSLIDRVPTLVGARRKEAEALLAAEGRAQEALTAARKAVDVAELDLRSRSEHIAKLELQLNTAKSNAEYQGLQSQIQRLRDESSRQEDETLAVYDRIETLESDLAAARARTKAKQAELADFEAVCQKDADEARSEIEATDERRASMLQDLPADVRATYERLREAREGVAIVPIEAGTCSGCGIALTPNTRARVLGCSAIITCDSCQRILYEPQSLRDPG